MIEILRAPPFMTVQDLGRTGMRSLGVPPSGAMVPEWLELANLLVGNTARAAGLEWALGSGMLRLDRRAAIVAAGAALTVNGETLPAWTAIMAQAGDAIGLELPEQRFACLTISGGIDVPQVLGARATYLVAGFGGLEGRRLRTGDRLPVGSVDYTPPDTVWSLPPHLLPRSLHAIRVVPGPQSEMFDESAWQALLGGSYRIASASDRMGYRLEGPPLRHLGPPALPSEAVCPGAVQVPDGGAPIVLMPDGPTVGGYPKLAAVITADLGEFAQKAPGVGVEFSLVTFEEAVAALADQRARIRETARFFDVVEDGRRRSQLVEEG
jgi:biotin-dependent carboxylase-like uncharacterized protein